MLSCAWASPVPCHAHRQAVLCWPDCYPYVQHSILCSNSIHFLILVPFKEFLFYTHSYFNPRYFTNPFQHTHLYHIYSVILCLCCNIQLHMTIQVQLLSYKWQFNLVGTRQSYSISLACLFFSPFSLILFIILLQSPSFYFVFSFRYWSKHIVALRALCFNFWAWNWILGF